MFVLEILFLGLALAIDASVVAFALSLLHKDETTSLKVSRGVIAALVFGFFQFLMLWFGSYFGYLFTFSSYGYFFQFSTGFIFIALALKCVHESFSLEERRVEWSIVPFLLLAFVTSIDAFAAGISLGTLPRAWFAALEVGLITFVMCGSFYFLGQFFRDIPDRWLLRFAGLIFFVMGGQIIWSYKHLFLRG
ncbi:MAG: manganese efflux pump MntP family protein [Bacteriovoracia bacterium]